MSRARVVTSIVSKISDYRDGEIASIDSDHIDRWVSQFDEPVQVPILAELDHVLSKTYISRSAFETFFAEVVTSADLVPDQEEAKEYAASLTYPLVRRGGDAVGKNGFFSSGAGRHLLEQEFLKAGALIRSESPNLKMYARPLGNCVRQNLGFGAVIVTYRNCANNCPLVFWAGDHPLFQRNNN